MKFSELLDDVLKWNLFRFVIANIYVTEFQKQGLPHAHVLKTLDSGSKIHTKDDIDKYISAEIPDQNVNPRLCEIVTKCMTHGHCGTLNQCLSCMTKCMYVVKTFPSSLEIQLQKMLMDTLSTEEDLKPLLKLESIKWIINGLFHIIHGY